MPKTAASRKAVAGSLESNDIFITISSASGEENDIIVESIVLQQFGDDIRATIAACLQQFALQGVTVAANDKGALECTIRARMETAVCRYKECA